VHKPKRRKEAGKGKPGSAKEPKSKPGKKPPKSSKLAAASAALSELDDLFDGLSAAKREAARAERREQVSWT
jgi:HD superfamily phosphodiesterase